MKEEGLSREEGGGLGCTPDLVQKFTKDPPVGSSHCGMGVKDQEMSLW